MSTFALKLVEFLPPNLQNNFQQLVIDDNCPSDDFFASMENSGNQAKNVEKLQTIILQIARGIRVPPNWCKELKHRDKKDSYPDFELRANQLRLYFFEDEEEGKIIVLGELKKGKKTQNKAIKKMRKIKLEYFSEK